MNSGTFSEESLGAYQQLLSSSQGFPNGQIYDFARCVRPDGSFYGTRGKCKPPNRLSLDNGKGKEKSKGSIGVKVDEPPIGSGISNESYEVLSKLTSKKVDKVTSDLSSRRDLQYKFLKDSVE